MLEQVSLKLDYTTKQGRISLGNQAQFVLVLREECLSALLSIMSETVYVLLEEKDDPLDKVTKELKSNSKAKVLGVGVKGGLVRVKKVLEAFVQVQTLSPHLNFKLSLSNNGLESLSEEVCELMSQLNLVYLNLNYNKLKSLPASFSKLSKLQTLVLYSNEFRSIPLCVGQLTQLEELHVGGK